MQTMCGLSFQVAPTVKPTFAVSAGIRQRSRAVERGFYDQFYALGASCYRRGLRLRLFAVQEVLYMFRHIRHKVWV